MIIFGWFRAKYCAHRLVRLGLAVCFGIWFAALMPLYGEPKQSCADGRCSIDYEAAFFAQYRPINALDMVRNLPGFSLDEGDDETRGFGSVAGNILINGKRITAKSESASDLLARIPASDVEKIILIRGQTGGLDLQGQTVIANIIRRGTDATGTWRLEASVDTPASAIRPSAELSYSGAVGRVDYTASLEGGEFQIYTEQNENVSGIDGTLLETRSELLNIVGDFFSGALTASTDITNAEVNLTTAFDYSNQKGGETSDRDPVSGMAETLFQGSSEEVTDFELGFDIAKPLGADVRLKLIGLYRSEDYRETGSLVRTDASMAVNTEAETEFESVDTEAILRLESDYSGLSGHLIELSVEGTLNDLDSDFILREASPFGLITIDVPGAQTKVSEERIDLRLSDATQLAGIALEAAIGAEWSTITQTGGFEASQSFFFWKPSLTLSYDLDRQTQIRGNLVREIGQLDFFDFVSSTDLEDGELALGNPELSPEATVSLDITFERRFGEVGVVSLTAFHDWIEDVEDVLPLQGGLEVPGNIGSGRRSGLRGETTLPLALLGLDNARLDANASWQTSTVTDPLTGEDRALSGEEGWDAEIEFRQDITERDIAWGLRLFANDDAPFFGLNELETSGQRIDMDGFIEIRAFGGVRMRLEVEDIFRDGEARDRSVFAGPRDISPLALRERREASKSREFILQITSTF